jgi:hypothetical protein
MVWCEHCRDHFDEDHYEGGYHKVGTQWGPTGLRMAAEQREPRLIAAAHAVVAAHYKGELTDDLVGDLDMAASTLEVILSES